MPAPAAEPGMPDVAPPLVAHVIHHLRMGGMENGLVNLINHMPAQRYRHMVVCVEDYTDFRLRIRRPEVEVLALARSRVGVWGLRRELYRLFRRTRPTIVHSRNLSGLDALLPARLAGVPYRVHGEHGWDVDDIDGKALRPALLRKLHAPLVDRYITVSKDLERLLVERVRIPPRRVTQIYNGVDTERFAPGTPRPDGWLPPEWRGRDLVLAGSVGRMQAVKDHATLLRAFAALVQARPQQRDRLRLTIVGDGPTLVDTRALADSLGIGALCWFPGALDNTPDVFRSLDLFVLPSLNEGISNTILEAMAAALPVIATAVGGNVELVDERCGALFPVGDVAALGAAMQELLDDAALRQAKAAVARRLAVERYSLSAMVSGYAGVYDALRGVSASAASAPGR